jgi:hypothetical protein
VIDAGEDIDRGVAPLDGVDRGLDGTELALREQRLVALLDRAVGHRGDPLVAVLLADHAVPRVVETQERRYLAAAVGELRGPLFVCRRW